VHDLFFLCLAAGLLLPLSTGIALLICGGPRDENTFCDPMKLRAHWRGVLQASPLLIVVGAIGLAIF
jgi:hypothetical protein